MAIPKHSRIALYVYIVVAFTGLSTIVAARWATGYPNLALLVAGSSILFLFGLAALSFVLLTVDLYVVPALAKRPRKLKDDDKGVTPILGTLLMVGMMMSLIFPVMAAINSTEDVLSAHTEAQRQAAWCVRNPEVGAPDCPESVTPGGYSCTETAPGTLVCTRNDPPDPNDRDDDLGVT